MSPSLAQVVMALADRITPPARSEWSAAMRQEFEVLNGASGSLSWAFGCLVSALGWRLRSETPFIGALAAACVGAYWTYGQIFFVVVDWTSDRGQSWFGPMEVVQAVLMGGLALVLAVVWPRRAWMSALFLSLTWGLGAMAKYFLPITHDALGAPWDPSGVLGLPTILHPLWWLANQTWPGALGGMLGWSVSRLVGASRAASSERQR